jgi:transposase
MGHKPEQVAEMQTVSKPTIYGWIDRWWSGGVEGLANRPKSGRPLKANDAYSLKFLEVIEKEPSELGYDFTIWTIDRLRAHLEKETGIGLSEKPISSHVETQRIPVSAAEARFRPFAGQRCQGRGCR